MKIPSIGMRSPPVTYALAGSVLLGSLGVSVVTVALPSLADEFSAPTSTMQWVVIAYLLAATVTVVVAGKLGDALGSRRILLGGLTIFTVASALCALAQSLSALAAARAVQGIGAAVLMALPMSILKEAVGKDRIGSAMGLLGTMSAVGTALGPSLGGILLSGFGWRAVFVPLAALGVATTIASMTTIPADSPTTESESDRVDWFGAFLLGTALIFYSLLMSKAGGAGSSGFLLLAALMAVAAFVLVETKAEFPLVPIAVLRSQPVATALATNLILSMVMMTTLVVGPFYLSLSLKLDNRVIGLVMSVGPVTAALTGIAAGRAVDRFGTRAVMTAGLIETCIGFLSLALLPRYTGAAGYVISLIILTPGFQMFLAANGAALMTAAPDSQRGVLSGLLGLSRNLGFVTGASAMMTLFMFAVGDGNLSASAENAVADGFSITFMAASGLILCAILATSFSSREKL
ncbi:MFS transporter [Rhizobium halophilum]|uniref:MFS transporter n=1 Tax=Rhizobium halophilum TaxID=2846852 RepID=UPI001EFE40BC|nr:MFS transporter [Rhizobium halophilum]MCF6368125.1 MFS transporter [Rhizobium halophilum]